MSRTNISFRNLECSKQRAGNSIFLAKSKVLVAFLVASFFTLLAGCVSAPHEIVSLQEKEQQLIEGMRGNHLALVDAFVDQRLKSFDAFYFARYGPAFRKNWEMKFKQVRGRDYDQTKDFDLFHQDLVAEYEAQIRPIERIRSDLKVAITNSYSQILRAHAVVGDWIRSIEKLNKTERQVADDLLKSVNPALSFDKVDDQIKKIEETLTTKM